MNSTTKKRTASRAKARTPGTRVPETWRWHHGVLQSLRTRLSNSFDAASVAAGQPLEPDTNDQADCATDEFDHDLAMSLLMHDQDALNEVDAAIRRIHDGTYGVCEESGSAIPASRLRAVPWTRYRKEVQERLERQGLAKQTRLSPASDIHGPLARSRPAPPSASRPHKSKAERRKRPR